MGVVQGHVQVLLPGLHSLGLFRVKGLGFRDHRQLKLQNFNNTPETQSKKGRGKVLLIKSCQVPVPCLKRLPPYKPLDLAGLFMDVCLWTQTFWRTSWHIRYFSRPLTLNAKASLLILC